MKLTPDRQILFEISIFVLEIVASLFTALKWENIFLSFVSTYSKKIFEGTRKSLYLKFIFIPANEDFFTSLFISIFSVNNHNYLSIYPFMLFKL